MSEMTETTSPAVTEDSGEKQFDKDMTVGSAMSLHPNARWVFASYHLGGCSHCAISNEETIEQVAEGYGVPLENLLQDLNSLLLEAPAEAATEPGSEAVNATE